MAGNSIGQCFRVTTFGESHGISIGGIIDGIPSGLPLSENDLQYDLDRRRPGTSQYTSPRCELDHVRILSGVFQGKTTGTSIGIMIENIDYRSQDYDKIKNIYRPGHADYTYEKKYKHRDYRGGGRASARETAIRVAAGAVAKKYLLHKCNMKIRGYLEKMGDISCQFKDWNEVHNNPFFCPDKSRVQELEQLIHSLKNSGDSIGSQITIIADPVPVGLGEPVFDKLDADLAHALMSINAVKGVSIGDGFNVVKQKGSENRDEITNTGFKSNHSGGILGGISSGQPVIVHIALKPTSSIKIPAQTIDSDGNEVEIITQGRHDPCVGIRAIPVAEAMMAIVILDHLLRYRAQCDNNIF